MQITKFKRFAWEIFIFKNWAEQWIDPFKWLIDLNTNSPFFHLCIVRMEVYDKSFGNLKSK